MRLTESQIYAIKSCVLKHFPDVVVYLVGSRTKNHLKGGDIDLLLVCSEETKESLQKKKLYLSNQIQKQSAIDDTKVDLIIASTSDLEFDTFVASISEDKIKL